MSSSPRSRRGGGVGGNGGASLTLRTFLIVQLFTLACTCFITFFILYPPGDSYYSPLNIKYPYASLPTWGVQELYHDPNTYGSIFEGHKDRIVDWSIPTPNWVWVIGEKLMHFVEVTLPSRVVPPPAHLVHLLQGPAQIQLLRTIVLLGIPDLLADRVVSLRDMHRILKSAEHQTSQASILRSGLMSQDVDTPLPKFDTLPLSKLERLMSFALSIGYFEEVSYRGSHIYVHNAQSVILRTDHPNSQQPNTHTHTAPPSPITHPIANNWSLSFSFVVCAFSDLNNLLFHFSNEAYLVWHNLFYSILSPDDIGDIDSELLDTSFLSTIDLTSGTESYKLWSQQQQQQQQPSSTTTTTTTPYTGPKTSETIQQRKDAHERRKDMSNPQSQRRKDIETIRANIEPTTKSSTPPSSSPSSSPVGVKTAWEETFGLALWPFLESRPSLEHGFAKAMTQVDALANQALVHDYDWTHLQVFNPSTQQYELRKIDRLIDVGGALGSFLGQVLSHHTSIPHATLFDRTGSIGEAKKLWSPSSPSSSKYAHILRHTDIELVSGDFFDVSTLPQPSSEGPTKYILRQILHDWNDRDTMRILRNLRQLAGERTDVSVVIVEINKSPSDTSHVRHWVDFQMLICCNSKERTFVHWETIFEATGWKLNSPQTITTRSMFQIMELKTISQV